MNSEKEKINSEPKPTLDSIAQEMAEIIVATIDNRALFFDDKKNSQKNISSDHNGLTIDDDQKAETEIIKLNQKQNEQEKNIE